MRAEREALSVVFPIRQHQGREGALAAAFVQVRPRLTQGMGHEQVVAHKACG